MLNAYIELSKANLYINLNFFILFKLKNLIKSNYNK